MLLLLAALLAQDDVKLVKKHELLTSYRLPNGLEVILIENHAVPLATVEIAVRTGAFTETPRTSGLAHLYEHMFFKGNAALPTQEAYQKREAELGINSNGTTSTEAVKYFVTLPAYNFEAGIEFMAHALLHPLFDAEELKKEIQIVFGEYDRNESDPGFYLRQAVGRKLFHAYFYRKNPIGERDALAAATPALLKDFKERYYVPNNSALILQGDFDPKHALALARHYFGEQKWEAGADPHLTPPAPHPLITASQTVIVTRDFPQALLQIGQYGPNVGKSREETWDAYVADVLGTLLALPQSKFQRTLVDSGLCAQASWSYYTQHDGGETDFMAVCAPERIAEARAAMLGELEKFDDSDYFTEEDLRAAQRQLEVDSTFARERGQQFAVDLAFWWATAGTDFFLDYVPSVKKVTTADLKKFAQRWVIGKPHVMGILVSEENRKLAGAGDAAAAARDSGIVSFPLSNGLRVVHKPIKTNDVVAMQLFIDGGAQNLTPETAGVESLLLEAIQRGSKRFPKDAFQSRLAALGTELSAESNFDFSRLTVKCLKKDFPACLELFADAVAQPLLEESEIALIRDQMEKALTTSEANADPKVRVMANGLTFAGHPYFHRPTGSPESITRLTREVVAAHHQKVFTASQLLLVIVGDVDPKALEAAFGTLPQGTYTRPAPTPFAPVNGITIDIVDRSLPTTYVRGMFAAATLKDPDYAALRVGTEMLHDRLWDSVRTKAALSYAPQSGVAEFESNYGILYVTSTKPNDAIKLFYKEIERIKTEPLPPEEVKAAALKLYTQHFMRSEPNDGQAANIGRGVLIAGGPDAYDRIMERITNVTPEEVQAAMKKHVEKYRFGILGPKDWVDPEVFKRP